MNESTIQALFPQMSAPQRLALAMFAEMRGLLDGDDNLRLAAGQRDAQPQEHLRWTERYTALILRAAGVDPDRLRWCSWPGCVASYDATTGPVETGWMRRGADALLCPAHDQLGHHPSFAWNGDLVELIGRCSCDTRSEPLAPTNRGAVLAWWTTHVSELPEGGVR